MKIINHKVNGLQIGQRHVDGYINATQMCQANNKEWYQYWRLPSTQKYAKALAKDLGIDLIVNNPNRKNYASALVLTFRGGNSQQGTWVHPEVALDLAAWISVDFRILVNRWVREWMTTGQNPIQPEPTSTEIPADLSSALEELENLIISIRSHGRTIHTGSHQPVDPILFKSLHTLSHNQLSVINAAIQHLELLKRIAEMGNSSEATAPTSQHTINYLFSSPPTTENRKPKAKESKETKVKETRTKQLTNVNIKIANNQRQWLADTARMVRQNNSKPVPPSQRVYPQHLVGIAIQLLQNTSIDIEAAHSLRLERDETPATINIKISRQQQQWLTDTAKNIRDSNPQPTTPNERIYPQHLIGIAIELLQNAGINWQQVGSVDDITQGLTTAPFQITACLV
ncbi:hypothetical protein H1P_1830013 [Hyella patelloides LEGE 07179]|uniref:KilA-N domain-containing protein n=1 Tax=Hyella patelloides LEGE 07179 TaxID=945734 RepID=A0A563VP51_9CYAN|nr:KilA-N domain-containing protein [Hyella patelloides]VEP13115.1 hypothetical protein H1P_1830013 [Hyella patelloides LEGE 07179]